MLTSISFKCLSAGAIILFIAIASHCQPASHHHLAYRRLLPLMLRLLLLCYVASLSFKYIDVLLYKFHFNVFFSYFFISLNGINETPLRSVFVVTIHIFELCKVSVFFLILSLPFKTQTRIWKSIKLIVLEILYFHHHNHRHHLLAISGCVFALVLQWHSSGIFFEKRLQVRVYFA